MDTTYAYLVSGLVAISCEDDADAKSEGSEAGFRARRAWQAVGLRRSPLERFGDALLTQQFASDALQAPRRPWPRLSVRLFRGER